MSVGAIGAALVVIVVAVIVVLLRRDAVAERYDQMSIGIEDHCRLYTGGTRCEAYAECYRQGIEAAFPWEVMERVVETDDRTLITPEIEAAVQTLERECGSSVGLEVTG